MGIRPVFEKKKLKPSAHFSPQLVAKNALLASNKLLPIAAPFRNESTIKPVMGCGGSKTPKLTMILICDEDGQVPMPIVHPFPICGRVVFQGVDIKEILNSRTILPSESRIRVTSVGEKKIQYGNGRWIWQDRLGLQASTQWFGRLELNPGFGRSKGGQAARPTFARGMEIIFEMGETSPVQITPRQQGTYSRQGSDMDVKNWRVEPTGNTLKPIEESEET